MTSLAGYNPYPAGKGDLSNVTIDAGHPTGMMIKEFTGLNETNVYYYRSCSLIFDLEY